ncbi:ketoacyl-ACP synthase III family protein [Nocardia takedensis]|uniref:ketoacyl-ACP synthase III family protein n=2 Tax=Nocardia TaxID=1817 RepID=UPI0006CF233C|nr:ketoacyl-ACP synthase III family protein [Nocardia arizonensis]
MKVENVFLAGVGCADVGVVGVGEAVAAGWFEERAARESGLVSVTVAGGVPAPDLAVAAGRAALAGSGVDAAQVDAVFHTNVHPQGPDGWSAQHYVNRNTVNRPVTSVEIRNGCIGFFSALHLAVCFLGADRSRSAALLTAADNFGTPAVDRWRASRLFVLADGGGAVVLSKRGGFARVCSIDSISDPELEYRHRGGEPLFPPGLTTGARLNFAERLDYSRREGLAGGRVFTDLGAVLIETVERALKDAGIGLDDITRVVHDGFHRDAVHAILLDPLGIEEQRGIFDYTRTVGHAGPVDHIRGLEHLWRTGAVRAGEHVLLLSDAPGMEVACAVLQILTDA